MSWSSFLTARERRLKGSGLVVLVGSDGGVGSVGFMDHLVSVLYCIQLREKVH